MNKILDGKEFSKKLKQNIKEKVSEYKVEYNKVPKLVTVVLEFPANNSLLAGNQSV